MLYCMSVQAVAQLVKVVLSAAIAEVVIGLVVVVVVRCDLLYLDGWHRWRLRRPSCSRPRIHLNTTRLDLPRSPGNRHRNARHSLPLEGLDLIGTAAHLHPQLLHLVAEVLLRLQELLNLQLHVLSCWRHRFELSHSLLVLLCRMVVVVRPLHRHRHSMVSLRHGRSRGLRGRSAVLVAHKLELYWRKHPIVRRLGRDRGDTRDALRDNSAGRERIARWDRRRAVRVGRRCGRDHLNRRRGSA
mmetsp:Transcript_52376/g.94265  ORF Transcript_52376/g.94265 Transcript_52376/m.94265 type:complete len:243 (+) Transcript_52376:188-916(+)